MPGPTPDQEREELKAQRKRASQNGLLLGAISLALGAVICLIYLLLYKPWKFPQHMLPPAQRTAPARP